MTAPVWSSGPVALWDLGVGLVLRWPQGALAVDPGDGLARVRGADAEPLSAVVFTGSEPERIAGLFGLLVAHGRRGGGPLTLVHGLVDEGVPAIAAAWRQTDPRCHGVALTLEPLFDGDSLALPGGALGGFEAGGAIFVAAVDGVQVAFCGAAAPSDRLDRRLQGVDAAVVEVPGHAGAPGCAVVLRGAP